ncbi:transporter substrate-binding domain-containing protein [Plesiomonas sp.]|uniref:transporter substrate-binding domain-containing protein n=1 Tax=Plesiomonas sp. TaxID=2486279 RepID=UPI003F3152B7
MARFLVSISFLCCFFTQADEISALRFATDPTYPPFEYHNDQGQLAGFDIELAMALCDRLQRRCEFIEQPFNTILSGLRLGAYDAAIAALDINNTRLQLMSFTQPYLDNAAVLVVNTDNVTGPDVLKERLVGVQTGTTLMNFVVDGHLGEEITPLPYASYQEAFSDLIAGNIDAVFTDQAVALNWLNQHKESQWKILGHAYTSRDYFGQGLGIALPKQSHVLKRELNNALDAMRADGSLAALHQRYFPALPVQPK